MKPNSDKRGKVAQEAMLSSNQREVHCRLVESAELPKTTFKGRPIMRTALLIFACSLIPIVTCLAVSTLLTADAKISIPSASGWTTGTKNGCCSVCCNTTEIVATSTVIQPHSTLQTKSRLNSTVGTTTQSTQNLLIDIGETTEDRLNVKNTTSLKDFKVLTVVRSNVSTHMTAIVQDESTSSEPSALVIESTSTSIAPQQGERWLPFHKKFPTNPQNVYFVNDSLLGQPAPCSNAEKECLRVNRILFTGDGKCYSLGDGPGGCRFVVDRNEFEHNSRHIRGICAPNNLCRPFSTKLIRFAYDGQCVKMRHLQNFCGRGLVNLSQHFFGDYECAPVTGIQPETPVYISQPEVTGKCAFPNLRNDLTSVLNQERNLLIKYCSEEQSVCFARNEVWCREQGRCCNLLEQSHCPKQQRVVLSRKSWEENNVTSLCQAVYPCGKGARLMAFDGQCHNKTEIMRVLCPNGVLLPNAFGEMSCVTRDFYKHIIELKSNRPGVCEIVHRLSHDEQNQGIRLTPECGLTGFRSCIDAF